MLIFLDCETSGLIKRGLPLEAPEQPWVVSLAAELCDMQGAPLAFISTPIRANGRSIETGAERIHGVSSKLAGRTGVSELAALGVLCGRESFASQARYVIGHGVSFDRDVITGVLARQGRDPSAWVRPGLQFVDTMITAAPFCKIAREDGSYKWPSLDEACSTMLGEPARAGAHSAWDDLQRCKRLYFWLLERGALDLGQAA